MTTYEIEIRRNVWEGIHPIHWENTAVRTDALAFAAEVLDENPDSEVRVIATHHDGRRIAVKYLVNL